MINLLVSLPMEQETWKDIPDYEGYYQASTLGRIRSLDRIVPHPRLGSQFVRGVIFKPSLSKQGYLRVSLSMDGKLRYYCIHVLIAMTFLEHKPDGTHKVCVDHINNTQLDNRASNLQLTTARINSTKDRKGWSSKYIGVSWHKGEKKWISNIQIDGKNVRLGSFKNEKDAAQAYQNKLNEISIHDSCS